MQYMEAANTIPKQLDTEFYYFPILITGTFSFLSWEKGEETAGFVYFVMELLPVLCFCFLFLLVLGFFPPYFKSNEL